MTPDISIIIPAYNRWDLTKQLLDAIPDATFGKNPNVEIIVINNASKDKTATGLKKHYLAKTGQLRYQNLRKNINFSGACNLGAEIAKAQKLVFLNNDTIPFNDWLFMLGRELDADPEVGVVGSKLVYPNGTIQHAGVAFMRESKFPYHPYRGLMGDLPCVSHRRELQCVTGAVFAVRRKDFLDWGQFDPAYRNGGEDIDFCLRAYYKYGKKIVYNPSSVLIHLESQSPGRMLFNSENCEVFYKAWGDELIADEDLFYFEDGYHRIGWRSEVNETRLHVFERIANDPYGLTDNQSWLCVAYAQRQCLARNALKLANVLKSVPDWPKDAAVREWAAELCNYMSFPHEAYLHLKAALQCDKEEQKETLVRRLKSVAIGHIKPLK